MSLISNRHTAYTERHMICKLSVTFNVPVLIVNYLKSFDGLGIFELILRFLRHSYLFIIMSSLPY